MLAMVEGSHCGCIPHGVSHVSFLEALGDHKLVEHMKHIV